MTKEPQSPSLDDYLAEKKKVIDGYLDQFLPKATTYPAVIHEAMRYSVFAGGKRIRPTLTLATSDALDGEFEPSIHLACALEMIHTYSLIHDDLPAMDNDDFRRGLPTCHRKYGEGIAILAGNGLLTTAFRVLTEIPGGARVEQAKIQVINSLCQAIGTQGGVIAGQVVDLTTQGKEFSREELEYIHSSKTAALIETSIHGAALLAGAPESARERLRAFGRKIGLAFQIVDDILDVEGSASELGKRSGKDLLEKKATYPALFGVEKSRLIADQLIEEAIGELAFLGSSGEILKALAQFIARRRF